MKIRIPFILAALLILFSAMGCKKYEDGPALSFRSPVKRVSNHWRVDQAYEINAQETNDVTNITEMFEDYSVEYFENGTFMSYAHSHNPDTTFIQEGIWDLIESEQTLRIFNTEPQTLPEQLKMRILRLMEKQLWVEQDRDSVLWELRMVPN